MAVSVNLAKALDKAYEDKSVNEILDAPVSAISGVSDGDATLLDQAFGIKTVRDLGSNKYFAVAGVLVALAEPRGLTAGAAYPLKLLASDLDGTLVGPPGASRRARAPCSTPATPRASRSCSSPGARRAGSTGSATGRSGPPSAPTARSSSSCRLGRVLEATTFDPAVVLEVAARLRQCCPVRRSGSRRSTGFAMEPAYVRRYDDGPARSAPLEELRRGRAQVVKILLRVPGSRSDDLLAAARPVLSGRGRADALQRGRRHARDRGARGQQGRGAGPAGRALGIDAADVVAFGDMPNDIEMLRWAGLSYAMSGGHPEAVAAAKALAPPCEEDGVAQVRRGPARRRAERYWPVSGRGLAGVLRCGGSPPGTAGRARPRAGSWWRIPSSCIRAAICWATSAVWMPWNRPSSQPTSWAWAIRSSASVGVCVAERQGDPLQLGDQLGGQALLELGDRAAVDLRQPGPAGLVQRRAPDLLEQLLDHAADPHHLGRLLDQLDRVLASRGSPLAGRTPLSGLTLGRRRADAVRGHDDDPLAAGLVRLAGLVVLLAHPAILPDPRGSLLPGAAAPTRPSRPRGGPELAVRTGRTP